MKHNPDAVEYKGLEYSHFRTVQIRTHIRMGREYGDLAPLLLRADHESVSI